MEYRKLAGLKRLEGNPRTVKDKAFRDLCESLRKNRRFFEARPLILSDRTGDLVIIAGNMKADAAKAIGLDEVPTELISGLTEEQEREIVVRDNAHAGEWDFDVLAEGWGDLPLAEWGVPIPARAKPADVVVKEVEVSQVADRFWMSVIGPLPRQADALEKLVAALGMLDGVEVQLGVTKVDAAGELQPWSPGGGGQ